MATRRRRTAAEIAMAIEPGNRFSWMGKYVMRVTRTASRNPYTHYIIDEILDIPWWSARPLGDVDEWGSKHEHRARTSALEGWIATGKMIPLGRVAGAPTPAVAAPKPPPSKQKEVQMPQPKQKAKAAPKATPRKQRQPKATPKLKRQRQVFGHSDALALASQLLG
jgi:hypothetical protein